MSWHLDSFIIEPRQSHYQVYKYDIVWISTFTLSGSLIIYSKWISPFILSGSNLLHYLDLIFYIILSGSHFSHYLVLNFFKNAHYLDLIFYIIMISPFTLSGPYLLHYLNLTFLHYLDLTFSHYQDLTFLDRKDALRTLPLRSLFSWVSSSSSSEELVSLSVLSS